MCRQHAIDSYTILLKGKIIFVLSVELVGKCAWQILLFLLMLYPFGRGAMVHLVQTSTLYYCNLHPTPSVTRTFSSNVTQTFSYFSGSVRLIQTLNEVVYWYSIWKNKEEKLKRNESSICTFRHFSLSPQPEINMLTASAGRTDFF